MGHHCNYKSTYGNGCILRALDSDNSKEDEINHDIEGLAQNAWETRK
jgi:hypothetical protein